VPSNGCGTERPKRSPEAPRSSPRIGVRLSKLYRARAQKERAELSKYQETMLDRFRELDWDRGIIYAFLENVRRWVVRRSKVDETYKANLAARLGVTTGALDHYFREGMIDVGKWERLRSQPELKDKWPTPEEVRMHEHREAIAWLRRHVLHDREFKGAIQWDELLFVAVVHTMETDDANEAFKQCPEWLKQEYSTRKYKWRAGRLLDAMNEWGEAYRLFCLELERHGH